jgi:hypothetical protein
MSTFCFPPQKKLSVKRYSGIHCPSIITSLSGKLFDRLAAGYRVLQRSASKVLACLSNEGIKLFESINFNQLS